MVAQRARSDSPIQHSDIDTNAIANENNQVLVSSQNEFPEDNIDFKLARKNTFKKRWDSVNGRPGANLVVNRKSLNIEATKRQDNKIRVENLKFLEKL